MNPILIATNNIVEADTLKDELSKLGYQTTRADNPQDTFRIVEECDLSAIVLRFNNQDDYNVLEQIAIKENKEPTFLWSGKLDEKKLDDIQAGRQRYVVHVKHIDTLIVAIQTIDYIQKRGYNPLERGRGFGDLEFEGHHFILLSERLKNRHKSYQIGCSFFGVLILALPTHVLMSYISHYPESYTTSNKFLLGMMVVPGAYLIAEGMTTIAKGTPWPVISRILKYSAKAYNEVLRIVSYRKK